MVIAMVVLIIGANVMLAVWATGAIMRDAYSERAQKVAQLALVWFVPAIGALVVLAVHRKAEKPSGRYRADVDVGDDFGASNSGLRRTIDVLDD